MTDSTTEAEAAAELGRLSTAVEPYELHDESSIVVVRVRTDERVDVVDLEKHLDYPRSPRGSVVLHDHLDFAAYVNRLGDAAITTVWADVERSSITAVLNDHGDQEQTSTVGWRDHRVSLQLRIDPDWTKWLEFNNKPMGQATFAEHIENLVHTIVRPTAADMLEISRTFQAKRNVDFSQGIRLDSGDVQLTYEETTTAAAGRKSNMEIPSEFDLALAPYYGTTPGVVSARLRYRIADDHKLRLTYQMVRPDLVLRDAFLGVLASVREQLRTEAVFNGTAPQALR